SLLAGHRSEGPDALLARDSRVPPSAPLGRYQRSGVESLSLRQGQGGARREVDVRAAASARFLGVRRDERRSRAEHGTGHPSTGAPSDSDAVGRARRPLSRLLRVHRAPRTPVKLSIVTICLNDLKGLKRTLGSLEEQTRSDFEQWVIDGGSTDGTPELLT